MLQKLASTVFLALAVLSAVSRAEDLPKLTPAAEAKQHAGAEITVEMEVMSAKKSMKHMKVFLDSEADFRDPKNLGVAVDLFAAGELERKHGTTDLTSFLRNKRIRVRGIVSIREDRAYLDIDDAARLELLKN